VYPRKVAARLLLSDLELTGESMSLQFKEKYGRVHLITSEENKSVQRHQRVGVFKSPDEAYALAGITFVELPEEALRKVKRRDRETIEFFAIQFADQSKTAPSARAEERGNGRS